MFLSRNRRLAAASATVLALVAGSLVVADAALADSAPTAPTNPKTPATVSAVSLPTPQINGVVWTQTVVGNTVFVGGKFSTARPDGALPGRSTVKRSSILAYDIRTGALIAKFAPVLNGQVKTIVPSADKKRLYIGGDFTTVNGTTRNRIAAISPASGNVVSSFRASANKQVSAIGVYGSTVYAGGAFTTMDGRSRVKVAAVSSSKGALTSWAPKLKGGDVTSIAIAPRGTRVVLGGAFTSVNGSSTYGYGLASLVRTTGKTTRWAVDRVVRNAGANSAITSLTATSTGVIGTAFRFGTSGNFEGAFRADWSTGAVRWLETCRGDVYSAAVSGSVVYTAGHAHNCDSVGGFRETKPVTHRRALAFTLAATQKLNDRGSGPNAAFTGRPSPSLLNWYPELTPGTFTGKQQAAWSVAATSKYVLYGGEFTAVNGRPQQGLARFAAPASAAQSTGPVSNGAGFLPTVTSTVPGTATVSWKSNADPDNSTLTYQLYRDSLNDAPLYEVKADSSVWYRPRLSFTDTGLTAGATYSYRIRAIDPYGNAALGDRVSVTIASSAPPAYAASVLADKPTSFWRFGQASGSTVRDEKGLAPLTVFGKPVPRAAGSSADRTTATQFTGATSTYAGTAEPSTTTAGAQTIEAWVKVPKGKGGTVVVFGDSIGRTSGATDRMLYVSSKGLPGFDLRSTTTGDLLGKRSIADGKWHQLALTATTKSAQLFVDGKVVASRTAAISLPSRWGYWRVAGDRSTIAKPYLTGTVDDVSLYPRALSSSRIAAHFTASKKAPASK